MTRKPGFRELLQLTAATGTPPTGPEITAAMSGGGRAERDQARRAVLRAARRIINRLADGDDATLDRDIEETIAEVEEQHAVVSPPADGRRPPSPRELADSIVERGREGAVDRERRRADAGTKRKLLAPLQDVLRGAVLARRPLRPSDFAEFQVADGVDRERWAADAVRAARRIADVHRSGRMAVAERLADQAAAQLGEHLVAVEHEDPYVDETDPAALADAIRSRGARAGRAS